MFDGLLGIDVVDGPAPIVVFAAAALLLVALLLRRPSRAWLLRLAVAVPAGLLAAVVTWLVCVRWLNLFGESLGYGNYAWLGAAFVGVAIAVASIRRRPRWRIPVALGAIPVFLLAAAVGINANYGLDRTVASVLAIAVPRPLKLAPPANASSAEYDSTLWKHWKPPADMPAHGTLGTASIPGTVSGFHARDAGLYLPPAALVAHPPALPLIVMMMGQPGNPDPEPIAEVLDGYAATHHGLAPVVVVADQLGSPYDDTLCLDTARFGNAETYITKDVTAWAEKTLPVTRDHRFWTAAGYSNGGLCALSFAIDHPELFNSILDISGEEFPGAEHPDRTLKEAFGGNQQAYDAAKPFIKLRHFTHAGMSAIFTACRDDPVFHHVAIQALAASRGAGIDSAFVDVAVGGHGRGALMGGLTGGVKLLYPLLGLEQPG
ncbi:MULTISPECIES: alpha/beta hydrolase-fold protein [unclassified Leifsonia]|uniref:alpha/beta hydrolase n=1 Tax=unclassified Leifsonia TaxID=2663824 RepID=UPI0008A7D2B0|nr:MULTISPECIES: alpha/beta hydrolase-fold protein [unclassified Leifsonia]SEH67042.1 Enterochelin esterase [Leifsonia sp. CL154]SFL28722.1 Enterochelin esterase [Leifsonia sp. CL147]